MQIVHYPHPALRHNSRPLKKVDAQLRQMIREMFELMYQHKGVGLAANQVALPYRLFVMNAEGDAERPDLERVLINPVLSKPKGQSEAEEGCLSIPNVYADLIRPERISIHAYDLSGNEIEEELSGLPARIVQHETDHLEGRLFIDRLSTPAQLDIRSALDEMEAEYRGRIERGELNEQKMRDELAELERLRT